MSSLEDLSRHAQRYQLKRNRSSSSSSVSSSSSSGYGSILSQDEPEEEEKNQPQNQSQSNNLNLSHNRSNPKNSNQFSDSKDLKLDINNKGMKLLLKMGWIQGNGLGVAQNGRKEPIPTPAQTPLLGLGKATQDAYMLSNAISKPKELESLVIARENEQAKVKREEKVKEIQTRVVEREDRLKTFHCHTCDKGYTTISQFEEHERSYAHHHAKRALEAKEARKVTGRSTEAKIEKERKREAKELERMARAAGMSLDSSRSSASIAKPEITKSSGIDGFKKPSSGWTKLAPPSSAPSINKDETTNAMVGSQIVDRSTFHSSFHHNTSNEVDAAASPSFRFKSTGFAPISTASSSVSTVHNPTGQTISKPIQTSLKSSSTCNFEKLAPKFVTSSLQSESDSQSSSINPITKVGGATDSTPKAPTPTTTPAPTSKFAQIAARLAARKANSALPSGSSAPVDGGKAANPCPLNPSPPTNSSHDQYSSEIEKMLDI